jgi:CheY-like chemotaxis protein
MITSADERMHAQAQAAGVTRVLGKPYPEDVLLSLIAQAASAAAAAAGAVPAAPHQG